MQTTNFKIKIIQSFFRQKEDDYLGFEVFKAVATKNAIFWDVAPCGIIISRRFGETYAKTENNRPDFSSERVPHINKSVTV
jgi:hypothetical protein